MKRQRAGISLEWKLPIAICALLAVVTIVLGWSGYVGVERSAREVATSRLDALATTLVSSLQASARGTERRAHGLAADPAVQAFARNPTPAARRQVEAAFSAAATQDTTVVATTLRDGDARVLIGIGPLVERAAGLPLPGRTRTPSSPDSAAVGPFAALGDSVLMPVVALVNVDGRRVGYITQWRWLGRNPRTREQIAVLLGPGARLSIGGLTGVWTDQMEMVPRPDSALLLRNDVARYEDERGAHFALPRVVTGTPWMILLELPVATVMAPVRAFRERTALIGGALLVLSFTIVWLLSRRITRPLRALTHAATEISEGHYQGRVNHPGTDELARLAIAFNVMTERVEDEVAGRVRSEEQWRHLFERNPQPMWVFDLDTLCFLAVNDAAIGQYGFSREEFLRMSITDIRPPEEAAHLQESLNRGGLVRALAARHRRKGGASLDVEISSHALDFAGRRARLVMAQDVSTRTGLEAQLRQAQKMEAVGRLAGGVAHDFNNLLTVMMTYADLVRAELPDGDPRADDLDVIIRTTSQAHGLTRQLLAFSRQQVLQPVVVDPNAAITEVSRMLRRVIGEDIEYRTELDQDIGRVKVDRGQFDQLLLNLVVNARDAMPDGGQLIIRTRNGIADPEMAQLNGMPADCPCVMISVTDTGTGMSDETRSRIFEPFFTTKDIGKGTGLGLATVYGVVRQSGGYVRVESELGKGTTFEICLPRLAEADAGTAGGGAEAKVSGGTETILLVEDDPAVRGVTAELLKRNGYSVVVATQAEEALAAAREDRHFDLVITDVVMPGMDGPTLVSRLRELRPGMRALFMSGYAGDDIVRRGVLESGVPFLEKPFSVKALTRKVRDVLDMGLAL